MKVLINNYKNNSAGKEIKKIESYPRKHICENCQSELEYEESDIRVGALGCAYLDCPLCGYDNMIEENEKTITLTANNIQFPTHFWHTSKENGAVERCFNEEIKKDIRRAIEYFRKNKEDYNWYTECGDTYVSVSRYDGEEDYYVVVTNNYYHTHIPFEPEDY